MLNNPIALKYKEKKNMHKLPTLHKRTFMKETDPDFVPILIREIDLGQPLPMLSAIDKQRERTYMRVRCLVRLHTQPIGLVDFTFESCELSPHKYALQIWQALGEQINMHLREDSLPEVSMLDTNGLPSMSKPKCLEEREAFLQRAPFISVVLSTRDRLDRLARCLPSLLAQQYPSYEIIVVDNAPTSRATADFIKQTYAAESRIHYVRGRPSRAIFRT